MRLSGETRVRAGMCDCQDHAPKLYRHFSTLENDDTSRCGPVTVLPRNHADLGGSRLYRHFVSSFCSSKNDDTFPQCCPTRRGTGDMTVPRTREAGAGHMSQTRAGPGAEISARAVTAVAPIFAETTAAYLARYVAVLLAVLCDFR